MSVSYSECLILEAIKTIFPDAVQTHRFPWLVSPKGFQSEVDIFIPSLNLAIEYDGFAFHNSPKNHTADQFKAYQISNHGMNLLHIREENLPVLLTRNGMSVLEVSSDYSDQAMQEKCTEILSQIKSLFPDKFPDLNHSTLPDFNIIKDSAQNCYNQQNKELMEDVNTIRFFYAKRPHFSSDNIYKNSRVWKAIENVRESYKKGFLDHKTISSITAIDTTILDQSLIQAEKRTQEDYDRILQKADRYYQKNGNLWVSSDCQDKELVSFVKEARKNHDSSYVSEEVKQQYLKLETIDPKVFLTNNQIWEKMYQKAVDLKRELGTLYAIPATVEYNQINAWIQNQDRKYFSVYPKYSWGQERIEKLRNLEEGYFERTVDRSVGQWKYMYSQLEQYYQKNGHTFVSEKENMALHDWMYEQRDMYYAKSGIFSSAVQKDFDPATDLQKLNPMFFVESKDSEDVFFQWKADTIALINITNKLYETENTTNPEKTVQDILRDFGYHTIVEKGKGYHDVKVDNRDSDIKIPIPKTNNIEALRLSALGQVVDQIHRRLFIDGAKYSELSKREVLDRTLYTIGLRVQLYKGNEVVNLGKVPFLVPKNAKFDALTDYIQKRINTIESQFPTTYTRKNTFHSSH